MKKLQKYLLSEFLVFFFGALFFFVVLVTIADLSSRLEYYTRNTQHMRYFIIYHLMRAPHNLYYIFPVALMFSSTYVLGTFVKNKEMLAIQNSGISLFKFTVPLFVIVIILCLSLVAFWQFVAAPANKVVFSTNDIIYNRSKSTERNNISFFGSDGYVYFIDTYYYESRTMRNAVILHLLDDGGIEMRISAPEVVWSNEDEKWYAKNAVISRFKSDKEISIEYIDNFQLNILERPELFDNPPLLDSMTLTEEYDLIKLRKSVNMNTNRFETDFHYRISYCFSGFVIVMLAALFSKFSTQSVLVVSLVMVIMVSLLYYSVLMFFRSLGDVGFIPPIIAAWMPNTIFAILCLISFKVFY